MKTIINRYHAENKLSGEEFAEKHNLTMVVNDCGDNYIYGRYEARFEKSEVKKGDFLISVFGVGMTPEAAIADYWHRISGETIVFDAHYRHGRRRELQVPQFVEINK